MLSAEQMANKVIEQGQEIARLWEHSKSAHRRIDDTDNMTKGIHELAQNIATMAANIKSLTERVDTSIERIENGQKSQGARIGEIEKAVLSLSRIEKYIDEHKKRLDTIEKAPAHKWDKFMWLVFAGVVGAIIAFVMSQIL